MFLAIAVDMHSKGAKFKSGFQGDILVPHHIFIIFSIRQRCALIIPSDEFVSLIRYCGYINIGIIWIFTCSSNGPRFRNVADYS